MYTFSEMINNGEHQMSVSFQTHEELIHLLRNYRGYRMVGEADVCACCGDKIEEVNPENN